MATWLPTGTLSDGTLLFGPLKKPYNDDDPHTIITVNGAPYWIYHSGKEINEDLEGKRWGQSIKIKDEFFLVAGSRTRSAFRSKFEWFLKS